MFLLYVGAVCFKSEKRFKESLALFLLRRDEAVSSANEWKLSRTGKRSDQPAQGTD